MDDNELHGAARCDTWMLQKGEYIIAIGLFIRDPENGDKPITVYRTESHVQVQSQQEARYYHNQFIDLKRRVRKLEKAAKRLF